MLYSSKGTSFPPKLKKSKLTSPAVYRHIFQQSGTCQAALEKQRGQP